ncbi:hypothetical protein [Kordiimonas sp.]|uniref:hypothetical protein n=1 Tax=Kordiimonas sp. TaxID=1970157 RepID=UPI003B52D592
MKSFVVAAMLLALTPTPGIASTLGPYDNLPIEELRQIDKDALSKAEKKAYKKALKAAEKAEKKRLKAEKKAKKEAQKVARNVLKVRDASRIIRDEFEADTQIKGPKYSYSDMQTVYQLGNGGEVQYFIRSYMNLEEGRLKSELYLIIKQKTVVDMDLLASKKLTPVGYANRQRLWANYSTAKLRGGVARELIPVNKSGDVSYGIGSFYEEAIISLDPQDLIAGLGNFSSFDFKLSRGKKSDLVISIPAHYITGYMIKFMQATGVENPVVAGVEQEFETMAQ